MPRFLYPILINFGLAGSNNRCGFSAAAYKPGKKEKNRKANHCLGREAPAGFLNAVIHDVSLDPFGSVSRR